MSEQAKPEIPEDLRELLLRINSDESAICLAFECAIPNGKARQLIERIGRLDAENRTLKATVERLSAPVSDEEWPCEADLSPVGRATKDEVNAILASRKATP